MAHDPLPLTETRQGGCGCGCTDEGIPALDVRVIPHAIRHATVFGAFGAIPAGGSMDLVAPHNPLPLLAQLRDRFGAVEVTYLDEGPDDWTLRLTRPA
ncbi:MAG TPA: DUF2249 domain-containing protein [Intrasporangium sp.]|uniref:DUF2249 domain-containing protein n=1 Tax=Intrasporangium sp. TaxID=1925024 RepID=UPI002D771BF1|nr:DUF2249 domain-containing protein [Intrasporangium sp.]HET7399170.1 DUF2249 domain-containing protein [Intrasporangium sp.]